MIWIFNIQITHPLILISMSKKLIIILGPTASGKSETGIQLAKILNTDIISSDSRQFYKEMSIGTARPSKAEMKGIPHHFSGHRSIHDYYNASMFEAEVIALLENLFRLHSSVLMVGGTGLYIDAVCKGMDDLPRVDQEVRNSLRMQYEKEGLKSLRMKLKVLDPVYYHTVDLKNPNRILKALEISIMTGRPYSSLLTTPNRKRSFHSLKIGLNPNREILYRNINTRVDEMVQKGLVKEAQRLFPYKNLNALKTVGYKELFDAFEGKTDVEEAIDLIKRHTRKYARKQLTWFRKDKDIHWFDPSEKLKITRFIKQGVLNKP